MAYPIQVKLIKNWELGYIMSEETEHIEVLIESLYILEKDSGICLFEENYVDITKDGISTDLISSFLSAILSFADETFADEIQHIQFSNRRILFNFSEHVLLVIAVHKETPATDFQIKRMIDNIASQFDQKYSIIFETDQWRGDITQFNDFSQELYEIVKREPLKLKLLQLIDFKEHFKKIENYVSEKVSEKAANLLKKKEQLENYISKKKRERDAEKRIQTLLEQKKELENNRDQ